MRVVHRFGANWFKLKVYHMSPRRFVEILRKAFSNIPDRIRAARSLGSTARFGQYVVDVIIPVLKGSVIFEYYEKRDDPWPIDSGQDYYIEFESEDEVWEFLEMFEDLLDELTRENVIEWDKIALDRTIRYCIRPPTPGE